MNIEYFDTQMHISYHQQVEDYWLFMFILNVQIEKTLIPTSSVDILKWKYSANTGQNSITGEH